MGFRKLLEFRRFVLFDSLSSSNYALNIQTMMIFAYALKSGRQAYAYLSIMKTVRSVNV